MSGLFALGYLAVFIGVPVAGVSLAWRRWKGGLQRGAAIFGGIVAMFVMLWLALGDQWAADNQVRELCTKDGGVKVYEAVKLPAEKFDKWGMVNFYKPTQGENTLGPEYVYKSETTYYRRDNPAMWRTHTKVMRRLDGKLLSESVSYSRRGGDLPGLWHPSSFSCPKEIGLIEKTFIRSDKEE